MATLTSTLPDYHSITKEIVNPKPRDTQHFAQLSEVTIRSYIILQLADGWLEGERCYSLRTALCSHNALMPVFRPMSRGSHNIPARQANMLRW